MKLVNVHRMLHIHRVEKKEESLVLKWEKLEEWRSFERILKPVIAQLPIRWYDMAFENAKLIFTDFQSEKEITCPIDMEVLSQGEIVVPDWDKYCRKHKNFLGHGRIYLVLRGWKNDIRYNYVLGGSDDHMDFAQKLIEPDEEEQLLRELCLVKTGVDESHWVLQWASGKQRIEALANSGVLHRDYLKVEKVYSGDDGMHVRLVKEIENSIEGSRIHFLAWDEDSGELCTMPGQYDSEANQVILDTACLNAVKELYLEGGKDRKLRIFPMTVSSLGSIYYYELKTVDLFPEETSGDKYSRIAAAVVLGEGGEASVALVASFTPSGYLHFTVGPQKNLLTDMFEAQAHSIRIANNEIRLVCRMPKSKLTLKAISLILRSKVQDKRYDFALSVKERRGYQVVTGTLPLDQVEWEQFYWDIRGVVAFDGIESEIRFKNHSKIKRLEMLLRNQQTIIQNGNYVVYPYLAKSHDFSVMYRARTAQDCWRFVWKEYLALFLYYLLRPYWLSRKYWLVYEKYSITAQDNSFYFFQYCMEKLSGKERKHIYYVIDKRAPDYQYVKQYGKHVIQFLSLKHMIYLKAAQLLISSDTKAHAYAWHSPNTVYREMLKLNKNAFLQHGVIYYKQCHQGLKKSGTNNCRLFIVSSEVEKQIIKDYFGYKDSEIAVTGLARWDVLHDTSVPGEKLILMMPTWRNWLEEVTEKEFRNSDYYRNYMALLNNPKLHSFLERKNVKMIFYIHPKFREYISAFATKSSHIQIVEFGSQPLNALLMKCNMMVTDYSSACWDVYYQGKPTLFYLFDYELYSQVQGSYVDMRTEAFGAATDDADELVRMMEALEENGFREDPKYAAMRDTLLPYRDDCNSERTYQILKEKFSK